MKTSAPVPPFQKPGPADYFQGRGPNRDGIVQGSKLPLDWRQGQPRELWRVDIGMGYSSPIVAGDRLYIMGWYDDATWAGAARVVSTAVAITSLVAWMCVRAAPSGSVPTCPRRSAGSWMWIARDSTR